MPFLPSPSPFNTYGFNQGARWRAHVYKHNSCSGESSNRAVFCSKHSCACAFSPSSLFPPFLCLPSPWVDITLIAATLPHHVSSQIGSPPPTLSTALIILRGVLPYWTVMVLRALAPSPRPKTTGPRHGDPFSSVSASYQRSIWCRLFGAQQRSLMGNVPDHLIDLG